MQFHMLAFFSGISPSFQAGREPFPLLLRKTFYRKHRPSAIRCFPFLFLKHSPSYRQRKRSRASLGMTVAEMAFSKHIRCTLREINPFSHTVISSAARNLPCTLLFLAPFAKVFPFSAITHTALYRCARKIPRLRSG